MRVGGLVGEDRGDVLAGIAAIVVLDGGLRVRVVCVY